MALGKEITRKIHTSVFVFLVVVLAGCGARGDDQTSKYPIAAAAGEVGSSQGAAVSNSPVNVAFFTPSGIPSGDLVSRMGFGMINVVNLEQLAASFELAVGQDFKVNVDFGPLIAAPMSPELIRQGYHDTSGNFYQKAFEPLSPAKLRQFPSDAELERQLSPYFDMLKKYQSNVGSIFLADEPYLNGITKSEMERAGRVARRQLETRGMGDVKLGVIFASGMFNADFASLMNRQSGNYVRGLDQHYEAGQMNLAKGGAVPGFVESDFENWIAAVKASRLTTYDIAGNMYTGGGIPDGFEVVAYDFYLSTILLDGVHEETLSWLASHVPGAGCEQFKGRKMREIRGNLSLFRDGKSVGDERLQGKDRRLLDSIFQCRMQAVTKMLENEIGSREVGVMMIAESSNNGTLDFDLLGRPKPEQSKSLVESRTFDEVARAKNFYLLNRSFFTEGLLFFLYDDAYDEGIKLSIGGAVGMPRVLNSIFEFSGKFETESAE